MSERVYSIPPAAAPRAQCLCRRASGTVPRVRFGEARPLLRGAQRPRGGGKLRGFAAHARRARERPERALFSAVGYGELSGFSRWVRPQPELSLQLVYPWGAAVVCGLWQGTPGGFSRGLAEVPLSALLPPTSWARKKSARPPGRDPAIYAAKGGTSGAPRRGAIKAFRPPGGTSKTAARQNALVILAAWKAAIPVKPRRAQRGKSKAPRRGAQKPLSAGRRPPLPKRERKKILSEYKALA